MVDSVHLIIKILKLEGILTVKGIALPSDSEPDLDGYSGN